jgi:hypothetical protein
VFSKFLRRTHLYFALFLAPWVLMYAASTLVMNHREFFRGKPPSPPAWEKVSETVYDGSFAEGATRAEIAGQLLVSLDLDGSHQHAQRDGKIVIQRHDPVHPVRVTFDPATKALRVERQRFDAGAFLERMHRRRGWETGYALDTVWAVCVDVFIFVVAFWVLSGLWMWWEMKATHRLGFLALGVGLGLFAFLVAVL